MYNCVRRFIIGRGANQSYNQGSRKPKMYELNNKFKGNTETITKRLLREQEIRKCTEIKKKV